MEFTRLLIGAGVDVTSGDWNAILGRHLASRVMSLEFCKEFLVLWIQAGGTVNVDIIIRYNEIMDLRNIQVTVSLNMNDELMLRGSCSHAKMEHCTD